MCKPLDNDNNSERVEDMATVEKVKSPTERFEESFKEYNSAKKENNKMMSFDEMMKRLEEDDE